ncbi:DNA damage-regulated autophagy modulator protein 1-like [Montipora foliosa]|uniref:DNA damage-regulated autophagy modulator protein 1-like n=1 Tax=Montipora foliosa TaxID=591990 RepID=UPI0035F202DF
MPTFSNVVRFLPLFWPLLICITILTPYIIAVSLGHVYPFLPTISKAAAYQPQNSIFGFLMAIVALCGLLALFCRYIQLDGIQDHSVDESILRRVRLLNKVSVPFAVGSFMGVLIVANFPTPISQELQIAVSLGGVHNAGSTLLFLSGVVYFWFQTLISFFTIKIGPNTKCTFFFRLSVSFVMTIVGLEFPVSFYLSYLKFHGSNAAFWDKDDGGYELHMLHSAGEWVTCLCIAIYVSSFYKEFQSFSIEVCAVAKGEIQTDKDGDYSKIKQHEDNQDDLDNFYS